MTRLSRRDLALRIWGLCYPEATEAVVPYILDQLRTRSTRRALSLDLIERYQRRKAVMLATYDQLHMPWQTRRAEIERLDREFLDLRPLIENADKLAPS